MLTTHSPVIVKELAFENLRLIYEDKNGKYIKSVEPSVLQYPSLNEVNYVAYGEATTEYHDELYGFLEFHQWVQGYKDGKKQVSYIKDGKSQSKTINLTKTEYIRHQIHHPENTKNPPFTRKDLKDSIDNMRTYIRQRAVKEGIF